MKIPRESTVNGWHEAIVKNGVTRVKLRTLLRHFGFKRRGSAVVDEVENCLLGEGLYVRGLREAGTLDESVMLSDKEMKQIGELASSELAIQRRFPRKIMPKLGLKLVQAEYSPARTRDRLDFLCTDKSGHAVAVELKVAGGDKRGVEQLMRYIGYLNREGGHKQPRGILITGFADPFTRHALEGREQDRHIEWWLYGLHGKTIRLEKLRVSRRR